MPYNEDEDYNGLEVDDVDFSESDEDYSSSSTNRGTPEDLFNSDGGNKKPPPKKTNLKIVGIITSIVLLILLFLLLTLGKLSLVKDDKNSIIPKETETEPIKKTESSISSTEKPVQKESIESYSDDIEQSSKNDTTSSNKGFSLFPSRNTISKESFTKNGEIKDVKLYEEPSLNTAQYLVTIRFYNEEDKEELTVYMTSADSANKLNRGDLIELSYRRTSENKSVLISSISLKDN